MSKILLAEDDESLGYALVEYLKLNDFDVKWAKTGSEGWKLFSEYPFDLCLLDVMMPEMDGFQLAEKIRETNQQVPIFFLTAKGLKVDKLRGFQIGADDYLVKPVDEEELIARIRSIFRRSSFSTQASSNNKMYLTKDIFLLKDFRTLSLEKKEITLTDKETELLSMLIKMKNQLLPREKSLKAIWGKNDYFTRRSMDVHIAKLRKVLKDSPEIEIRNIHGKGFILKVD